MGTGRAVQHHLLLSLAKVVALLGIAAVFLFAVLPKLHADYGASPILDSRTVVWLVMQLHLMFAAFVLGVLCWSSDFCVYSSCEKMLVESRH